jgi:hypothetical protein
MVHLPDLFLDGMAALVVVLCIDILVYSSRDNDTHGDEKCQACT